MAAKLKTPSGSVNAHGNQCVMCDELAPLIEGYVARYLEGPDIFREGRKHTVIDSGFGVLCREVSVIYGESEATMQRKLHDVRFAKKRTVTIRFAEALAEACGTSLRDANVAVLAGNSTGALEMIDAYYYAKDLPTPIHVSDEARSLSNFVKGYVWCDAPIVEVEKKKTKGEVAA